MGNQLFKAGDVKNAKTKYSAAIKLAPACDREHLATCFANRAACNSQLGDHKAAIIDCTHALRCNPSYAKAFFRRACALEALGEWPRAVEDFERAINLDSSFDGPTHSRRAAAYAKWRESISAKVDTLSDARNTLLRELSLPVEQFKSTLDEDKGHWHLKFSNVS